MVLIIPGLAIGFLITGGLMLRRYYRQSRIDHLRDDVRLRVIEAQMAALRAALRIQVAEHAARRHLHRLSDDTFRNCATHKEPGRWQR